MPKINFLYWLQILNSKISQTWLGLFFFFLTNSNNKNNGLLPWVDTVCALVTWLPLRVISEGWKNIFIWGLSRPRRQIWFLYCDTIYLEEKWSVCVCTVVKKQDSRSMSLVEKNQVISKIVLIWSYLVTKGWQNSQFGLNGLFCNGRCAAEDPIKC